MPDSGDGEGETGLTAAGPVEMARIAARGVASLFRRERPVGSMPATTGKTVVSEDTTREVRLPPRQVKTRKWPVLHVGPTPKVDLALWDLTATGLVEAPARWGWEEFRALPTTRVVADMHCVTRWSRLDNAWDGVLVADFVARARPTAGARYVVIHCENGFTTNLTIDDFVGADCLFAWSHDGQPLDAEHGGPLRLVVPRLYAWKSAKWVRGVEFVAEDRPGFWESNGYHNRGNPWDEERSSGPIRPKKFGRGAKSGAANP